MKCEQCGTQNLEGSSFCKKCGKVFDVKEEDLRNFDGVIPDDNNNNNVINDIDNSVAVYCQCGQKLEPNWKFCPNCKTPITVIIKNASNVEQSENTEDSNAIIYIIIFVISAAGGYFLKNPWGILVAIITIITGKIKYPKNLAISVLFWLTILVIVICLILVLWLMIACSNGANGMFRIRCYLDR